MQIGQEPAGERFEQERDAAVADERAGERRRHPVRRRVADRWSVFA